MQSDIKNLSKQNKELDSYSTEHEGHSIPAKDLTTALCTDTESKILTFCTIHQCPVLWEMRQNHSDGDYVGRQTPREF